MRHVRRLSRRELLLRTGASAAFLPLLAPRRARAAETPKRFMVMTIPNGYNDGEMLPSGSATNWTIPNTDHSPLKPLMPFKDKIIFMGGITIQAGKDSAVSKDGTKGLAGHGSLPFHLTAARGKPGPQISDSIVVSSGFASVDRYMAKNLPGNDARKLDSLVMRTAKRTSNDVFLSFDGPCLDGKTPNAPTPRYDPQQTFDDLFGGGAVGAADLAKLRRARKSVLDFTQGRLQSFCKQFLGTSDYQRCEEYWNGVRALEKQLQDGAGPGNGCAPVTRLGPPATGDYTTEVFNPNYETIVRAQIDLAIAAFSCDLTRISSMLWGDSANNAWIFPMLKDKDPLFTTVIPAGSDTGGFQPTGALWHHHAIAHNEGRFTKQKCYIDQWYLSHMAYAMSQLATKKDPEGTPMLDNTVILFTNTQRTGGGHQVDDLKWILGGNWKGSHFKTGRFLRKLSAGGGDIAQNPIFTELVNGIGCPPIKFYADAAYGGELPLLRG